jgi:diguanylate cyclase (GGDEF)-like protein
MTARSARWGVLLFLLSILLLAGMAVTAIAVGPFPGGILLNAVLPGVAVALGVVVLFAGHVSYPRVHNLRVYLAGYSVGVQSIVYAATIGFSFYFTDAVPLPPAGYGELVLLFAVVAPYAYSLLPSFPTYRATRITTWVLVGVQLAVLLSARLAPATFAWLDRLVSQGLITIPHVVFATLAVAAVVINALLPAQSFFLRGAFSGLAILAGGSAILPAALEAMGLGPVSDSFVRILFAGVAPLYLGISMLFHVLARMEHRVSYDPLLQIYNRDYCNLIIAEQSSISTRPPVAVMMIDIDHFKQVNDTYGHQAGDRILFSVAQSIQKMVVPEGVVCRYGGEEMIVFFPTRTGRDIVPLAQRLRASIEALETTWKRHRIGVTVSIGLSDRRSPRHSLSQVVRAADRALYIAKENGRNQVRFVRLKDPGAARR